MKDWDFVLIGNIHVDVSRLEGCDNIHFLGPKPHEKLPAYIQHWDVSLLPFKRTPQIEACNPLKLKEYMAAGTAIVSTDFPAVNMFGDIISIADTADSFVRAIRETQEEDHEHKRANMR